MILKTILIILPLLCMVAVSLKSSIEVNLKSLKCQFHSKYYGKSECKLDKSKNKYGTVHGFGEAIYKSEKLFADIDLFAIPINAYLVRIRKYDICTFWKTDLIYNFPFKGMALDFMNKYASDFAVGCPYPSQNYTINYIDVNATLGPMIPMIVIPGDYKLNVRIHAPNNDTMISLDATGEVIRKTSFE